MAHPFALREEAGAQAVLHRKMRRAGIGRGRGGWLIAGPNTIEGVRAGTGCGKHHHALIAVDRAGDVRRPKAAVHIVARFQHDGTEPRANMRRNHQVVGVDAGDADRRNLRGISRRGGNGCEEEAKTDTGSDRLGQGCDRFHKVAGRTLAHLEPNVTLQFLPRNLGWADPENPALREHPPTAPPRRSSPASVSPGTITPPTLGGFAQKADTPDCVATKEAAGGLLRHGRPSIAAGSEPHEIIPSFSPPHCRRPSQLDR